MSRRFARFALRIAVAGLMLSAAHFAEASTADRESHRLADEFVDHWVSQRPHVATRLGLHRWDSRLPPVSRSDLAREAERLHLFRLRLEAIERAELSFERALEYDVLLAQLDRELFEIEVTRPFESDPNAYVDLVAGSIEVLLERDFASLCTRLQRAARRLLAVPEVLRAARINLRTPSRVSTEMAIERFEGVLRYYREELPRIAAPCKHPLEQANLAEADSMAVWAVESFVAYLREDVLPKSHGNFAVGREAFEQMLATNEREGAPLDSLNARGMRALETTRERMVALATLIAPGDGPRAALDALEAVHPSAAQLAEDMAERLAEVRRFAEEHDLHAPVEEGRVRVRAMPAFRRGLSETGMDAPGVWEPRATEGYLEVRLVDPAWPVAARREHLQGFNRYAAGMLAVHEAFPGNYVQAMAARRLDSRVRQLFGSRSGSEGWAFYCEAMMIEQGYGGNDPRFELAQLDRELQRLGQWIVAIALHTRGMTPEEARMFFEEQCFMTPARAARATRSAMLDPACAVGVLGKWRILELREEARLRLGERFRLRDFHDAVLRQGAAPYPVGRAGVLHDLGLGGREGGP